MKHQTISKDIQAKDIGFEDVKKNLLEATGQFESKVKIQRIKLKVTFYWKERK